MYFERQSCRERWEGERCVCEGIGKEGVWGFGGVLVFCGGGELEEALRYPVEGLVNGELLWKGEIVRLGVWGAVWSGEEGKVCMSGVDFEDRTMGSMNA